ncbi:hypothetical protein HNQ95_005675 [Aminobacter ciceronei]|uniref:Uncharacterized protein n=1 Tax=Aminobacter ciceronei TaxID=150723 RepID=A0ABR6CF16_9HYPH|nr:hypothetical protein [Aminobacter ciceronei]MBA9023641.1 hypothetical protein [Aminobacter ciceronei]
MQWPNMGWLKGGTTTRSNPTLHTKLSDDRCVILQEFRFGANPIRAGAAAYASSQTFSRNMQNVGCMAMPFTCGAVWW